MEEKNEEDEEEMKEEEEMVEKFPPGPLGEITSRDFAIANRLYLFVQKAISRLAWQRESVGSLDKESRSWLLLGSFLAPSILPLISSARREKGLTNDELRTPRF